MRTSTIPVLAALLFASGCVDNRSSVEIFGICAPPTQADTCSEAATCANSLASPRLDHYLTVTFAGATVDNPLESWFQFNNQLVNNADVETGRVNTNDFTATELHLSYDASGVSIPSVHFATGAFTVPAAGTTTMVLSLIPETLSPQIGAAMTARGLTNVPVVVHLRLFGHLLDGSTIETGTFDVAVNVYNDDLCNATVGPAADPPFLSPCDCPTAGQSPFFCPGFDPFGTSSITCK
ncbi:MAG TPA: hypothetical protein VLU43_08180 [Anaeromyxobacteraceae bacterium]|nr:hypothetical protein [Anaeromyxobacteraceae bacterium]